MRPPHVWLLVREGNGWEWAVMSVHATRESAFSAIPEGSVFRPGDPDPLMCEPDEWRMPYRSDLWSYLRLRIQQWEVRP